MFRLGKSKELKSRLTPTLAVIFVLLWTIYSLLHLSPFAASWDEVDFVLALDRFDLLAMQPHFPGYPYFVVGAMAVQRIVSDPILAYGVGNVLITASAAWPLWFLARRLLSPMWSLLVILVVLTSPYLWLQALRPMSEAAGIALLWWYLLFWWRAMERRTWAAAWQALFLFSLLMGVRLSFAAFGLSLLWLLVVLGMDWRRKGQRLLPRIAWFAAIAGGFQLLWVAGLALSEGGFVGFVELAMSFTQGHFSQWGGGVASASQISLAERALRFAGDNLLWTGMFARSTALLAAAALLLLAAILRAGASGPPRGSASPRARWALRPAAWLSRPTLPLALAVLAGAYGAYALLAQNIDKPRHITPLIGLIWLLLLAIFRTAAQARQPARLQPISLTSMAKYRSETVSLTSMAKRRSQTVARTSMAQAAPRPPVHKTGASPSPPASLTAHASQAERSRSMLQIIGAALTLGVILLQAVLGGQLSAQQANERPAVYQLADAMARSSTAGNTNTVLYTWEETRVLEFLHTPMINRRIETYNYFIADIKANPHATILLTDHVLHGFEAQVGSLQGKVRQIANYQSNSLFDPVYSQITLYEWLR